MKLKKKVVASTTAASAALAVLLAGTHAASAQTQIGVTINGNQVDIEPIPILQAGRVFVPLRGVFEQLGASVVYADRTINATGNGRDISLQIGSTQATVNGQPQIIDVAPFIVGASTYVPLRFVSEALGDSVNWDEADGIVQISTSGGAPAAVSPDSDYYTDTPPPPLPVYDQPEVAQPDEIWQPGYWAWGPYGYYWVPGTWVQAPQPNYLWTPGYWQYSDGGFHFNPGFWALTVGFYGGVNYGAGYFGHGYAGGEWADGRFRYNTAVTHVDVNNVRNVYVDRTVINNTTINNTTINNVNVTHTSYNGGPGGVQATPTAQQLAVARAQHLGLTPAQRQHVQAAAQDRRLLASVNHSVPPVLAVAHPLSATNRPEGFVPVKPTDRVEQPHAAAAHGPAAHALPEEHAAPAHPAAEAAHHAPAEVHPAAEAAHPAAEAAHHAPAEVHPAAEAAHPPAEAAHHAPAEVHPAAPAPHPAAEAVHHAPAEVHPAAPAPHPAAEAVHHAPAEVHPAAAAPPAHKAPDEHPAPKEAKPDAEPHPKESKAPEQK